MVQSGQRFDEYIGSFITKFVTTSNKKVQSFVEVEIVVAKKKKIN